MAKLKEKKIHEYLLLNAIFLASLLCLKVKVPEMKKISQTLQIFY